MCRRFAAVVVGLAALSGCSEQSSPLELREVPDPSFERLDASSGGNKHFFFLAPIRNGAPTYSGTFDATLSPQVILREGGAVIVKLDAALGDGEQYQASLDTNEHALDPGKAYRLSVVVGGRVLGYADLDVLNNGSGIRNAVANDDVPLINGRVLPVKFRIEDGWRQDGYEQFFLADNGITVMCPDAQGGATGVVNGVTYTKRNEAELRALVSAGSYPSLATTCTSGVTNMTAMFWGAIAFNQDIGSWDVGAVTEMREMFLNARAFNQDIGSWDVGNVTDMSYLFYQAFAFNQDIGSWDVGEVTNMQGTFFNPRAFNQDIGSWDVGNVTNMSAMFYQAFAFNQDIGSWDVGNVTDMSAMFNGAYAFNQDIGKWDVGNVTNMSYLFFLARAFNQDIGSWDVGNVTNMRAMFYQALTFNQDLSGWCVTNILRLPASFDFEATSWTLVNYRPVWGTCPIAA